MHLNTYSSKNTGHSNSIPSKKKDYEMNIYIKDVSRERCLFPTSIDILNPSGLREEGQAFEEKASLTPMDYCISNHRGRKMKEMRKIKLL